jgi:hypothetical protein
VALRDKLAERATLMLFPGESARQVFLAQGGGSPWLVNLLGVFSAMFAKRRIIAVSDYAIVVIEANLNGTKPVRVLARLPRGIRLGPVRGIWSPINLGGEKLYVHRRFHKDIEAADRMFSR